MTTGIQPQKKWKRLDDKLDFLRRETAELLSELKSVAVIKNIKLEKSIDFDEEVKNFEIYLIERALERTGGSQIQAARLLKLKHSTLHAKIKRYAIRTRNLLEDTAYTENYR